jgi:tryprostatin B 6-hydroxylase
VSKLEKGTTMALAMDATHVSVYAAAAGALSHWTYFMHGEHHVQAPTLVRLALLIPVLALISAWQFTDLWLLQAAKYTALAVISYFTALWTSIIVYRVLFHRLRSFPGPFMFSVSKLWHVYKLAPSSDNYVQLDELHKKYGDFVRTGKQIAQAIGDELTPSRSIRDNDIRPRGGFHTSRNGHQMYKGPMVRCESTLYFYAHPAR